MVEKNWRRQLARELTRRSEATVGDILARPLSYIGTAQRSGFTGPPGAGKSSLIASMTEHRLRRNRKIGVLAVDPTSPISHGSILGDRIRMDLVADAGGMFIRSVPSGPCHDGLCRNIVGLLDAMELGGFDDIILETVGVGQINYEARVLVDTLVLVLVPESGDTIQAMKAGILEMADIYVINKADLPAAGRLAAELNSVLRGRVTRNGWQPPIVLTSTREARGIDELDKAIDAHYRNEQTAKYGASLTAKRRHYQLRALLIQRLDELIESGSLDITATANDVAEIYNAVLQDASMTLGKSS